MKHCIRDILIYLITYSGIAWFYRQYQRSRGPLVRVLCFHDVPDRAWFEATIAHLTRHYHVVTPEAFHAGHFSEEKINILLTFDDGYQSWVDVCMPVMERYGVKGIFFINSGLLDCAHDGVAVASYMHEQLLLKQVRQPLTWEGAVRLVKSGYTIGGHTVHHVRLSKVDEATVRTEASDDKTRLESMLGILIQDFAFPFGGKRDRSENMVDVITTMGYRFIYTTEAAFFERTHQLAVPRLCLEFGQSLSQVDLWVRGGYDIVKRVNKLI